MKTFLFILIFHGSATTAQLDSYSDCIEVATIVAENLAKNNIKGVQYGCFEELGGRKKDV